jgi:hypothetical protein
MTILTVGSTAARVWFPDWREPKDLDVFTDVEVAGERVEPFWDESFRNWLAPWEERTATPDELYTIKHSHAYWELRNGSWNKHMFDLLELERRGARFIPWLHDLLYAVWATRYGHKKVDLTQEAEDFFSDAVTRIYEHDSIHHSVAYTPGRPIYDECLKDGKSVQMDMAKVWAMPVERQLQMFREEVYVTALERLIIPSGYSYSPGAAYQWALRRTITSLTKGESAKFMVTNFHALRRPDMDYVDHHLANKDFLVKL